MYVRVFAPDGRLLAGIPDVPEQPRITSVGALVVPLPDGSRYVVNPCRWTDLTETPERPGDPETPGYEPDWLTESRQRRLRTDAFLRARTDHVHMTFPPVVPGPAEPKPPAEPAQQYRLGEPTPMGPLIVGTDQVPERGPLSIVCCCDQLRCPVILNPAPTNERRWWQRRQHDGSPTRGAGAPTPEPLMRCSFGVDHEGEHRWIPGDGDSPPGWPFGPTMHHDECPRHPLNQRERAEGQPGGKHVAPETAGITENMLTAVLTDERTFTDPALVRPTPETDPEGWMAELRELPGVSVQPYDQAKTGRGLCGFPCPDWGAAPEGSCDLTFNHNGPHQTTGRSGDAVRW